EAVAQPDQRQHQRNRYRYEQDAQQSTDRPLAQVRGYQFGNHFFRIAKLLGLHRDTQDSADLVRIVTPFFERNSRQVGVGIGQPQFFHFKEARAIAADALVVSDSSHIVRMPAPQQQRYLLQFQPGDYGIDIYRRPGHETDFQAHVATII